MGYLGDNLSDYYGYQLLDEVIRQIKEGDYGDVTKLIERLKEILNLLEKI